MNKRWQCPTGEHEGVLAPSKMRKDDVRRFCFPCSTKTGRLVARTCPSLEKERAAKQEARQTKAKQTRATARTRAEQVQEATRARETVGNSHLPTVAKKFWAALTEHPKAKRRFGPMPNLSLRRSARHDYYTGHAWGSHAVTMTLGRVDEARALTVVLHELAHCAMPGHGHDMLWRQVFRDTAMKLWGVEVGVLPDGHRYVLDDLIVRELRKKLGLPEGSLGWLDHNKRVKERREERRAACVSETEIRQQRPPLPSPSQEVAT